jgi:sporulation protein YlmC with PRC-barrel domain
MAHFLSLAEYQFTDTADDIRGADLFGNNDEKFGKVKDVIFDHQTGEIRYLVVDTGKRHVGVPADRVFRSTTDEDAFRVDMSRQQLDRLPEFKDEYLENEHHWSEFHNRQEESLKGWREEMERKYKQGGWHEGPVQHRHGSTRNITPEPQEIAGPRAVNEPAVLRSDVPARGFGSLGEEIEPFDESAQEVEHGEDLSPHRIAGKFPDTAQGPQKLNLHPEVAREERSPQSYSVGTQNMPGQQDNPSEMTNVGDALDTSVEDAEERRALFTPSNRWRRFEDLLRKNRVDIMAKCSSCAPARDKAA